jgi:hypothetical protein
MRRAWVGNTRISVQAYIGCGDASSLASDEASLG